MKRPLLISLVLLVLAACSGAPSRDSVHGNWQVMTHESGKAMLCYGGAAPIESRGRVVRRSQPYLMVTRRLSGKIELSASSGYDYKPGSKVQITIDGHHHRLFFNHSVAWAKEDAEDKAIIDHMQTAKRIELRAVSESGAVSVDTYSPAGLSEALLRIKTLCP